MALERSASATEAVDVIAQLNDKYGVEYSGVDSPKLSLLICDPSEVWVMDVVGKYWAAENISGRLLFSVKAHLVCQIKIILD